MINSSIIPKNSEGLKKMFFEKLKKQAGAELCQAQDQFGLVWFGMEFPKFADRQK